MDVKNNVRNFFSYLCLLTFSQKCLKYQHLTKIVLRSYQLMPLVFDFL